MSKFDENHKISVGTSNFYLSAGLNSIVTKLTTKTIMR